MADKILTIDNFSGGISTASKIGLQGSFRFAQGCDIHSDPDRLQMMPASTKDSGSTVVDLPLFASTNTVNTNIYFLGDVGKLYKRTFAGSWSVLNTYTNAEGMGFFSGTNKIFFCSDDTEYQLNPADDSVSTGRTLNSADFHPVESFLDKIFIGNGRELISTDASNINYDSTTVGGGINIEYNYKIRCLKNVGEYLFIGAESDNSSMAKGYLWDGVSGNWNYSFALRGEDGVNAVEVSDTGTVLISCGKQGNLYQLTGLTTNFVKIKKIPRIEKSKTIEVFPGAICNYQGGIRFGLSDGTSLTAERGVYSYYSNDKNYPQVLNLDFATSDGTMTGTTVQIGSLLSANTTDLYIGWRSGSDYGVDLVNGTGTQSTALYETLIHNDGKSFQKKYYKNFKVKLADDLESGETITLAYKSDRASTWTDIGTLSYASDGAINVKRFKHDVKCYELETKLSGSLDIDSLSIVFSDEPLV